MNRIQDRINAIRHIEALGEKLGFTDEVVGDEIRFSSHDGDVNERMRIRLEFLMGSFAPKKVTFKIEMTAWTNLTFTNHTCHRDGWILLREVGERANKALHRLGNPDKELLKVCDVLVDFSDTDAEELRAVYGDD